MTLLEMLVFVWFITPDVVHNTCPYKAYHDITLNLITGIKRTMETLC